MQLSFCKRYIPYSLSILRLGLPIVIAQLGLIIQSIADTVMIGQYGTYELSAASFTNNLFNLTYFFLLGYSYGTTPVIGYNYGKNDDVAVGRTLKESLIGNVSLSLIISLLNIYIKYKYN